MILDIINALNYENVTDRVLDCDRVNAVDDEWATEQRLGMGIPPALTFRKPF